MKMQPDKRFEVEVPTYDPAAQATHSGFCSPLVPVLAYWEDGLRVILGSHDEGDNVPDVLIERCPQGWRLIVHPGNGDAVCALIVRDDGKAFIIPEVGEDVQIVQNESEVFN